VSVDLPSRAGDSAQGLAPLLGGKLQRAVSDGTTRRLFNVAAALIGLGLCALPFLLIMAVIKATSRGPVFFRQVRVGRGGKLFRIYKFRTRVDRRPPGAAQIVDEPSSLTPVGRFLRRSKLDELPQLINVLIGEMNLVGPRPELPEFVERYPRRDRAIILSAAPGLTDFASIRFRNEEQLLAGQVDPLIYYERVVMPAKLRYCRFYVRHASLGLDLYLIGLTIIALMRDHLPGAPAQSAPGRSRISLPPPIRPAGRSRWPRRRPKHTSSLDFDESINCR